MGNKRTGGKRRVILASVGLLVGAFGLAAYSPAAIEGGGELPADCSREAIIRYAWLAPASFEREKKGLLYGVETHTSATRVGNNPGENSCALVVYAILKKAGCGWVKYTADAKGIYDMAVAKGWRPADSQEGGCIVAWNSLPDGPRPAIGREEGMGRVLFRHVGITTSRWLSVDNTASLSRPLPFITWRPYRYRSPTFLCPPPVAAGEESRVKLPEASQRQRRG